MARAPVYAYPKLGDRRGGKRLWLEGRKLERVGIEPGMQYSVIWDRESRTVTLDFTAQEGDRKVSRRSRGGREMPIIDIGSSDLEEALGSGLERAKVTINSSKIVVQVHPDDEAARERLDRLVAKVRAGEPLATGSLAHGGGILDHAVHAGLKDVGIEAKLAFAVEIDDQVLEAAARNNPIWDEDTLQIHAGMEEVETEVLPKVDILIAGIPCTGASKAGKAKNHNKETEFHDKAGVLFVPFLQIVKKVGPSVVVLENVTDYAHSVGAHVIRKTLETWGYELHETVLEGNAMGVLESRRRLCLVGISPEIGLALDRIVPIREKEKSLSEILENIGPNSDLWRPYGNLLRKAAADLEKGRNFKLNLVTGAAEAIGTLGAGYSKVRNTEAKLVHPSDSTLMRQLTPVEHARAKGAPPELIRDLPATLAHTILGNSVSHAAWQAFGRLLGKSIQDAAGVSVLNIEASEVSMTDLASLLPREMPEEEEPELGMGMGM
ncbi:DNA (cytosine-5)-methyltransferase 1 [Bradyrhizobium sp. USDA 4341]